MKPVREIRQILDRYPPDCQPTQIEPLGSAGGMSGAQFWRLAAPRGDLVLRRWPPEHPTPDRLRFIHSVLAHAATRGITILPIPIATRNGQSFVHFAGHLWELAPWMPGTADYERAPSYEKLRAAMMALAQFHVAVGDFTSPTAPGSAGGLSAIHRRLTRLRDLAHGDQHELASAITNEHWPELAPLARRFIAALPDALPRAIALLGPLANAALPLQPCLRDIWHDHVLFTGNQVTGLVDFGGVDIDTPACDIARLLGSLVRDDSIGWQAGLEVYTSVRQLSNDELQAVAALDVSGTLLAGCNWIRWIYIDHRHFENRQQVISRFRVILGRCQTPHQTRIIDSHQPGTA